MGKNPVASKNKLTRVNNIGEKNVIADFFIDVVH
jgi:hypothetical protein